MRRAWEGGECGGSYSFNRGIRLGVTGNIIFEQRVYLGERVSQENNMQRKGFPGSRNSQYKSRRKDCAWRFEGQ